MDRTNQRKNQHLSWRAGFGPMAEDLGSLVTAPHESYLDAFWKGSSGDIVPVKVTDDSLNDLVMTSMGAGGMKKRDLSVDEKKEIQKQTVQDLKSLNLAWLGEMVDTQAQLREKMALFWHGHFASKNFNVFYQQSILDIIRRGALGNFGDLLREVSKSAAMINFLNNNQNRKDHPNENFAREVMELFTMGRGNYTEDDVKEAARAFTGWGANGQGAFEFRPRQHDEGQKTVLGKTGYLTGDDVLNILLEQKSTAHFISAKIYRYLVNDQEDEGHIDWLAGRFYQSNYDIQSLLGDIFKSDWFYDEKNMGSRIKSPVDLLVGIRRLLPMQIENEDIQIVFERLLGQELLSPPNVAGWPGGFSWIDSSSLMFRMQLPRLIYGAGEFHERPKDDDDRMMGMNPMTNPMTDMPGEWKGSRRWQGATGAFGAAQIRARQMIRADIDWTAYLQRFDKVQDEALSAEIQTVVLQTRSGIRDATLQKQVKGSDRESRIKSLTIALMSTPEYQLC